MWQETVSGPTAKSLVNRVPGWWILFVLAALLIGTGACGSSRNLSYLFDTDAEAPPDSLLAYTVYLIGDTGAPFDADGALKPVLRLLDRELSTEASNSALVFLGDNIYPSGLPHPSAPNREAMEARIMAQLEIIEDFPGQIVFIPGNHDWGGNGLGGEPATLNRQEAFIEQELNRGNVFLPDGGFPGPSVVELADSIVVIAIDTQWWLEPNKIYGDTGQYELELEGEFLIELDDVLRRYADWRKIIVGHHPLFSNGEHGGYFSSRDDLFVIAPLSRRYLGTPQDISNRKYRVLRQGLLAVFQQHPNLIYAAGHDHNLQYFIQGEQHHIISGSGSKQGYVAHDRGEVFAADRHGFATLRYYRDGSVWLTFMTPGSESGEGEVLWSAAIIEPTEDGTVRAIAAGRVPAGEVGTPVESVAEVDTSETTVEGALPDEPVAASNITEIQGRDRTTTTGQVRGGRGDGEIGGTVAQGAGPTPRSAIGTGGATDGRTADEMRAGRSDLDDGDQGDRDAEGDEEPDEETGEDDEDGGDEEETGTPHATRAQGIPLQEPYEFCAEETVTVSASARYRAGWFHELFLGSGYRDVWRKPLDVPVIDLECTAGGLTPIKRGGGLQTISLRMLGGDGDQYVLRSIDKDPTQSIPEYLRETVAEDVVQDQISAINPYGAFIIPPLARAANVLHTHPTLTYIPDSPALGMYREDFAGMLSLMEIRPDEDQSDEARLGFSKNVVGTPKLFEELLEDNDESVDVRAWVRARLLDMLVGDWDRHKDQWRWAEFEGPHGTIYEPVPRDRDFAFFRFGGLPGLLARWLGDPKMRRFSNFGPNYGDVLGLNYNGAAMDRRLTGPVDRQVWLEVADSLRTVITDDVIEEAVRQWPDPIYEEIGEYTIESLKARRDKLPSVASRYYDLLAHIVDLTGTDKHERFEIRVLDDSSLEVAAYKTKKERDVVRELYRRTFDEEETGEIRIYGFGGEDTFVISGEGKTSINVRIIGGEGEDLLIDEVPDGAGFVTFYDTETGTTVQQPEGEVHLRLSDEPGINAYNDERFEYNIVAPVASFGYNGTSGLFLGGGVKIVSPSFRKYPYGQRHVFEANFAVRERAYNVRYTGDFINVYKGWNADIRAGLLAVNNFRSFYGLGNETDQDARDLYNAQIQYIRVQPTASRGVAPLTSHLGPFTTFSIGPRFEYANVEPPDGILEDNPDPTLTRFTSDDFTDAYYAGVHASLVINGLDTLVAKESGVRWANEASFNAGVRGTDNRFVRLATDLRYFYTFTFQPRTTLALRVGAAHNFGDFAFYQANALGGESTLRGYPTTRFSGRTTFFQNIEARTKLFDFNAYLTRGEFGALAFFDNGRVWWDDESSRKWHQGFGGGLWVIPFNQVAIVSTLGFSPDEGPQFDLSLGFLF